MQREFWLERWANDEIGFHQAEVNPLLRCHWPQLDIDADAPVFVPLCGKSRDMCWLAEREHPVVGVELAEVAVRAFFEEAGQPFQIEHRAYHQLFLGGPYSIFVGDFMDLTAVELRGTAAVFDRGALVALPPRMRAHYADHLQRIIADGVQILLLTLEYEQNRMKGPPHAVHADEVQALFGERCRVELVERLHSAQLPPRFTAAGITEAAEAVYLIVKER
ncbi:MAG: thiopurine S-methyltransferase [Pseudomonadales bacterium]